MAELIYTHINPTNKRDIALAIRTLEESGIIAYPTDVNWAIGCDATSQKGLQRIQRIKPEHPKDQPFSLIFTSISHIAEYAVVDNYAYRIMKKCLPGPYTFLLTRGKNLPKLLKDKRQIVGARIPDCELVLDIVRALGRPLASSSLPLPPDGVPLSYGYEIDSKIGHQLDLILDLGDPLPNEETTIIDLSSGEAQLIRQGKGPFPLQDI